MAVDILNPVRELGYLAKREFMLLMGKQAVVESVGSAGTALGSATGGPLSMIGVLTMGLVAAISAGLSQMDFIHKKDSLKEFYKDELAAQFGKPKDKVTVADLEILAANNKTIGQELRRSVKQRNFGIGVSFIATMAALGAISALTMAVTLAPIGLTLAGIGTFAIHGLVGMMAYKAVEDPVHWIADKVFGLDDRTTNDYIVAIERDHENGKTISREQVLAVFVAANPELDKLIVANFGKHFNDLDASGKQRAAAQINQILPLDRLTMEINSTSPQSNNAAELAFAVEGKVSGAQHEGDMLEAHRRGLGALMHNVGEKINHSRVGHHLAEKAAEKLSSTQFVTPVAAEGEQPSVSFVQRLGLKKRHEMAHVERVDQSREQAVLGLQQS